MEHIYELVISYCSAHSSNSVCQTGPLPYSQTVCLTLLLSSSLSLSVCITDTLTHTHTHTYTIAPHHSGWLIFINIEIVEQLGFQLKAPFILPCLHLRIIAPLFSASVAESVQRGVLIALESLSLFYQEMTQPFKKKNKGKKKTSILSITRVHATLICCFLQLQIVFTSLASAFEHSFNGFPAFVKSSRDVVALFCRQV